MVDISALPNENMTMTKLVDQNNLKERLNTRVDYRYLISGLYIDKPELVIPEDKQLFTRLNRCNELFEEVRTPREGVLDAVALKTISSLAYIQTAAIGKKGTTKEAFQLARKCAKIIKNHLADSEDVTAGFYQEFCHCHKTVGMMNFMSGRLPTFWFERRRLEKSFMTPRTRRIREIIDASQHTKVKLITKMSSEGEQTSKEIVRINRCLEEAYENNNNQPISFFTFTIHPTLFSRSVENIFHVSFLIKEGKAELLLDENQLPVLRPSNKSNSQLTMSSSNDDDVADKQSEQVQSLTQLVLSLDMEQWENLVQIYVTSPKSQIITMSAGIMPDMYRHTARKSTVSKALKSSAILPVCNNPTTPYATYNNNTNHLDNESRQDSIIDITPCQIKVEEESPQQSQQRESFLIIPDNETEQMIIAEEYSHTNEDVICDILEQILDQITQPSIETTQSSSTQISRTASVDTQDVHSALDSIMNLVTENDNTDLLPSIATENQTETNVYTNVCENTPMECEGQVSTHLQSHVDDDIVEIEATSNAFRSDSCMCLCHKPVLSANDDYILFERALIQIRQKQQQERLLNNNCILQTLKRQHEELINIYQQNKNPKSSTATKIDQEQQTKSNVRDSQIQTDTAPIRNGKAESQYKPTLSSQSTNNSHFSQTTSRTYTTAFNTTSTGVVSKKSTMITKTTVISNNQSNVPSVLPPSPVSSNTSTSNTSHDVVDLTEEDEDDDANSQISTSRPVPIRQSTSATHLSTTSTATSSSSSLSPTAATTAATRTRPINRTIRPNNTTPNGQTFPLRSLPEHDPCDHSIARPQLGITQENATVRLTWNLPATPMESIHTYEIFAYKQSVTASTSDWKRIGTVKSMRLPMAVTLKEFQSNSHYAFAVRAVSTTNTIGPFCEPKTIFTGNTSVQPLHTSQLLNVPIP
ncbi:unnamed protein product [Adineta ricciae]|uniref:Fibronectin type-III domain-containing protein n=1 Tax=Adineta ricciae TaxID=249248 RepID=A0A813QC02_ADIRI|nr:unnamed protein product [Adineta ricciae]